MPDALGLAASAFNLVTELDDASFTGAVRQGHGVSLVTFHEKGNPICDGLTSALRELSWRYIRSVQHYTVDVAAGPAAAFQLNVVELPTSILFSTGQAWDRVTTPDPERLLALLRNRLDWNVQRPQSSRDSLGDQRKGVAPLKLLLQLHATLP